MPTTFPSFYISHNKLALPEPGITSTLARVKNIGYLSSAFQRSLDSKPNVPNLGALFAPPRFGKTTASAGLANRENAIFVRANSTWSPTLMLLAILLELSIDPISRRPSDLLPLAAAAISHSNCPLFIDEADYLFRNLKMLDIARDLYDLTNRPIWFIGLIDFKQKVARRPIIADRIAHWVEFQPCDLEDLRLLIEKLCSVSIHESLRKKLLDQSKGNIRRLTVGLTRIDAYAKARRLEAIGCEEWGDRPFFFAKENPSDAS